MIMAMSLEYLVVMVVAMSLKILAIFIYDQVVIVVIVAMGNGLHSSREHGTETVTDVTRIHIIQVKTICLSL